MPAYKSFAFISYGFTNEALIDYFLAHSDNQYDLRVLTRAGKRPSPKLESLQSKGVAVYPVDYNSPESLEGALRGVDVIVSGLRDAGLSAQPPVARAAKKTGVKLFVPSEYGIDTRGQTSAYLKPKADLHALLKELGLPYTLYFIGLFPDTVKQLSGLMGLDFVNGKFNISEGGTGKSSYTDPASFVPFIYHTLTTLPPSELEWRAFQIEAERKSLLDLIADWQAKFPHKKAEIHHRTPQEHAEFRKVVDAIPGVDFLSEGITKGVAFSAPDAFQVWPEWGPIVRAIDVIAPSA